MIVEMRIYTLKPGTTAKFEANFEKGLLNRLKLSPLGAFLRIEKARFYRFGRAPCHSNSTRDVRYARAE